MNFIDRYNDNQGRMIITKKGFNAIKRHAVIFEGRRGGLVLGKSHAEGGIHLLQKCGAGSYRYVGEMEGNEYLSPPNLSDEVFNQLEKINKNIPISVEESPGNLNVIDLRGQQIQIILLVRSKYFIINGKSTMSNLNKIASVVQDRSLIGQMKRQLRGIRQSVKSLNLRP